MSNHGHQPPGSPPYSRPLPQLPPVAPLRLSSDKQLEDLGYPPRELPNPYDARRSPPFVPQLPRPYDQQTYDGRRSPPFVPQLPQPYDQQPYDPRRLSQDYSPRHSGSFSHDSHHPSSFSNEPRPRVSPSHTPPASSSYTPPVSSSYTPPEAPLFAFPEPQLIYRSLSYGVTPTQANPNPNPEWRRSPTLAAASPSDEREAFDSFAFEGLNSPGASLDRVPSIHSEAIEAQTLDEDSLRRYQEGELPANQAEWYKLVPKEALTALPKGEITRQSVLFELINSERIYIADLEILHDFFLNPLLQTEPAIIPRERLDDFIREVFHNVADIIGRHQRMLADLYARQREQHPLIESVTDIILNTVLTFRETYEDYIKHYPLAEARYRREALRNPKFKAFLESCAQRPETSKKGLDHYLFRPVSRLPRLHLLLENVLKHTEPDHPDQADLPVLLRTLSDFIKSTEPGVQAAESKVKFHALCESLQYRKGEIIDMDLHDHKRTLVHSGILARREGTLHSWQDFDCGLLDNYFIITTKSTVGGIVKHQIISRPIPVEFIQVGPFGLPESRREEKEEGAGLTATLFRGTRQMYPFTLYHKAAPQRKYTLYAPSESARTKWGEIIKETINIRRIYVDSNRFFEPKLMVDDYFKSRTVFTTGDSQKFHGRITCAATFRSADRAFIAVGTADGVHVGRLGEPSSMQLVLKLKHVTALTIVQQYAKIIILTHGSLVAYSSDIIARVAQGLSPGTALDASLEKLSDSSSVMFFAVGIIIDKTLVSYAVKGYSKTTIHIIEMAHHSRASSILHRRQTSRVFRDFGKDFYIPYTAHDSRILTKTIVFATERGITIIDPTNLSFVMTVPDLTSASTDVAVNNLKSKCESSKPLQIVTVSDNERLIVYEEIGVYVTKYGVPTRKSAFVRWEVKAHSCAIRPPHILLINPDFVEIRHANTGRLIQVVEGKDIRQVQQPGVEDDHGSLLIAMRHRAPPSGPDEKPGAFQDERSPDGVIDTLYDLIKTVPLLPQTPDPYAGYPDMTPSSEPIEMPVADTTPSTMSALWDEWDA